jgi:hypothetical protein
MNKYKYWEKKKEEESKSAFIIAMAIIIALIIAKAKDEIASEKEIEELITHDTIIEMQHEWQKK